MKLNKLLAMSAVVACGLTLASCGGKEVTVGIGYSGSFGESYGNMQLDLTAAMVSFEADGTIADVRLDVVQVKVGANDEKTGLVLKNTNLDEAGSVKSKLELGKDYNMKGSSAIGVEVDSQIEAFADWTVGKTIEEVKASLIPGSGHGVAPHADLASTCTITVDDFVSAIESAWDNRSSASYKVSKTAKIGIGMKSGLAYNYGNPTKEISIDVAGTVVDGGKVVAASVDAIVYPVAIAEDGTMSTDTASKYIDENGLVVSKKALGDAYAMRPASPVGKEWFEQAAIIEAAAIGKTATEIEGLVANEGDLVGATMTLTSYTAMLAKSARYAEMALIGPQA